MNIGKDNADVVSVLEYSYCFVSVCSFNSPITCILYRLHSTQANEWFIFDNEDRWCSGLTLQGTSSFLTLVTPQLIYQVTVREIVPMGTGSPIALA